MRPSRNRRGGSGCEVQAERYNQRAGARVDAETLLGAILIAAWAAVVGACAHSHGGKEGT